MSASPREVASRFGFLAPFIPVDNPASAALTRSRLGWEPTGRTLLDDLRHGDYFTP